MPLRFTENSNATSYVGQPGSIDYALTGDTSFYARPGGLQMFVGSLTGVDTFVAAPNSVTMVLDPGTATSSDSSNHTINAYGLTLFNPTNTRAYIIDNRHLYLYDSNSKEGVVLLDWTKSNVEWIRFSDYLDSVGLLQFVLEVRPQLAPHLTWEQSGLGISTADANEAITYYTQRAQALQAEAAGFNAAYYMAANPDVAAAGIDPLTHYSGNGWKEGRNPSAFFNTAFYLAKNPDVAAAGIDPLMHYESVGWKEGREAGTGTAGGFDTLTYLKLNTDVAAAGLNPLDHYMVTGVKEGRRIA